MNRRFLCLILSFYMLLTITGCWNNRDLSELAIASAFGIDRTEDGKVMVSVQILQPSAAKAGGKDGGGGDKKGYVVVSNTADTIFGALREMLSRVSLRIFYSSAQVIIIGEDAARAGIEDYIDFTLRDHETQFKTLVAVSKGTTAKEILEKEFDLSNVPGAYIRDILNNADSRAFNKNMILLEVARELATEGKELSIGAIKIDGNTPSAEGMAVFLKGKMAGWLDSFETRGYMLATGRLEGTIIEVADPQGSKKQLAIEVQKTNKKQSIEFNSHGKPEVNIEIGIQANIGEQYAGGSMKEDEIARLIAVSCNKKVKNEILQTITKCQKEYKSDIFGFGAKVFDVAPDYWKSVREKWNPEIFPELKVNIEVKTKILRSGLIGKSIEVK
ncbi:Ger(x)C family spore germination protein [Pseudobacteroides cellulosolvens]|uniref:Germination protein, Ger(X)C family n=1 Tax=Pseudobacteroides cellulosolvens ATCC 35603 = DSM 2933 TaxID=398512 RepID=A0A0L6JHQ6_9FIRM|nr:Ger(x)C family spore germination protein [Pseudobacteroides cellulosolvens]KNY25386.1 germination protein, Ger(x)C family [Pseudobacteroides cellulosolvens ATCC 35603 = DSM 2933]